MSAERLKAISEEEWEALCDGCGHCCNLARTGVACPGLDTVSNRCTVYKNRTEKEVCVKVRPGNVLHLYKRGILPETCGYVRYQVLGVPYEHARLDSMRGAARLIPFNMAHPDLQADYFRQRKVWFARVERDNRGEEKA